MSYELLSYKSVDKRLNDITYTNYYYRLMLIARSLFKWNNLPNNIDEKWIERYLFSEGACLFFKHPELGFMVTKFSDDGKLNYYDEPTKVRAYATDFVSIDLYNNADSIIIRNNDDMIPTFPTIQIYSAKLTNIERTIDTNLSAQKMPFVITCSDKQRLSFKQAIKLRDDNTPVIYGDKNLDLNDIKVLKTDAPVIFDKLQVQKMNVWNECLTFLGINNANTNKRERLITNEVNANDQMIQANEDVMLKARERACELINKMFGLNISVERRSGLKFESPEDVNILDEKGDNIDDTING